MRDPAWNTWHTCLYNTRRTHLTPSVHFPEWDKWVKWTKWAAGGPGRASGGKASVPQVGQVCCKWGKWAAGVSSPSSGVQIGQVCCKWVKCATLGSLDMQTTGGEKTVAECSPLALGMHESMQRPLPAPGCNSRRSLVPTLCAATSTRPPRSIRFSRSGKASRPVWAGQCEVAESVHARRSLAAVSHAPARVELPAMRPVTEACLLLEGLLSNRSGGGLFPSFLSVCSSALAASTILGQTSHALRGQARQSGRQNGQ